MRNWEVHAGAPSLATCSPKSAGPEPPEPAHCGRDGGPSPHRPEHGRKISLEQQCPHHNSPQSRSLTSAWLKVGIFGVNRGRGLGSSHTVPLGASASHSGFTHLGTRGGRTSRESLAPVTQVTCRGCLGWGESRIKLTHLDLRASHGVGPHRSQHPAVLEDQRAQGWESRMAELPVGRG